MKRISLLLLLTFFTGVAIAQVSVKSIRLIENDLDARVNYKKTDQNGEVCAIIKVVTSQTGFSFDVGSLGVIAAEQKVGEIWVYVPRGVQYITISHQQLGVLRRHPFNIPIQAATAYEMVLVSGTVETIVKPTEIQTQWLAITTTPEGANVFVEERLMGATPYTGQFPEGDYTYRIELPRYHPEAGKITLKGKKETLSFTMRPRFGNISVTSSPESGIMIYLNDENTGKTTPATLTEVTSGNQTLKLMSQWYQPQAKTVTVNDNQTTTAAFTMEPAFANITVKTTPSADILINGTKKATGTYTDRMLTGIYTLKAELDKHYPEERQLVVEAGKAQNIPLELKPKTGRIDITSTPFDAKIKLNGKDYGTTPNTVKDLLVGSYTLTLTKPGYGTVTKTLTITEGKTTDVSETLPSGMEVTIISTPSGAQLWVDGSPSPEPVEGKGSTTPWTGTLAFGSHTLKLVNGKKEVTETITVTQGGKSRWEYNVSEFGNFTETATGLNLEMVAVRGGTFQMGDTFGDGESDEKPVHSVTVSDFYMGKYEVTQAQWRAVMGASTTLSNPSYFKNCDNCPVEQVSWNDIREFLKKLNQKTGKTYRLPTEAEWEYAAKGGAQGKGYKYAGSNSIDEVAWYNSNSSTKTHPVGGKKPNELGIYDMTGNVWEWCSDWYGSSYYSSSPSTNPQGAKSGSYRVDRGGSWDNYAGYGRVSNRRNDDPGYRSSYLGFRLCLAP